MDNTFFLPLDTIVLWGKTGETIEVQGNHSESLVTGDRVASETHSERASRRRTALVRKTRSVRTVHWQVARGAASTRGAVRQFLKHSRHVYAVTRQASLLGLHPRETETSVQRTTEGGMSLVASSSTA